MSNPTYPEESDQDFLDAMEGFKVAMNPCIIYLAADADKEEADKTIIWNNDAYKFVDETPKSSVNSSLLRQTKLCHIQGLFEVVPGIYQVRGLDLANITFVETDTGFIVIDPLTSYECAKEALKLYTEWLDVEHPHKPQRIMATIYTHCHGDHFGGAGAIVEAAKEGGYPMGEIYAPDGFLDHAVSENVYAGNAMLRRAVYMYGISLKPGYDGQVGTGLGCATSTGRSEIIRPTITISKTTLLDDPYDIDGVEVLFQVTPGTEAPSEMNFFFPGFNALCMAENASHTLHNIQTLRGAPVRDARVWSEYLDEAIVLYANDSVVSFASHHWPTFGKENVIKYLSNQRDMYAYLHNETLRRLNNGEIGSEIAEDFVLPKTLNDLWSCRGYYGSLSHNVKAVYNRYMGWFDANPAHLWEYPPVEAANLYVACMGGIEAATTIGENYAKGVGVEKDLRFAATILSHCVFCSTANEWARIQLNSVFTQLGYGSENATWRNFYLTGAKELIDPITAAPNAINTESFIDLSIQQLMDTWAIRVLGPEAGTMAPFTIDLVIEWPKKVKPRYSGWHMNMSNGALTGYSYPSRGRFPSQGIPEVQAGLNMKLTHRQLVDQVVAAHAQDPLSLNGLEWVGNEELWLRITRLITPQNPAFAIVTPEPVKPIKK